MSQGLQPSVSTVLLLETDPSIRRMITLGLRHRGLHVIESISLSTLSARDVQKLDLLIVDVDDGIRCDRAMLEAAQAHPQLSALPTVVLSWEPLIEQKDQQVAVTKPFDARALHAGIDQLLLARSAAQIQQLQQAEALLLASYAKHTAPSIWPAITAAGVLLVVIGLLLQFAITIIGLLVIVCGLLLWTIGSHTSVEKPELSLTVGK
ncbi:hypothetical protein [Dictyobacter arantiisoli]|uniref:Response regulatory domain-containing protein n=1 Tax=Dictyobacter arantiisoli TaxID=2014874 RepID=A0A5A5TBL6_9CHLR|nr:hypothetical protein [Dictyobacter arantiisoli]GCF08314.1 hypothetical protein KDI_18780 [Dictyobacter arantiisoli]